VKRLILLYCLSLEFSITNTHIQTHFVPCVLLLQHFLHISSPYILHLMTFYRDFPICICHIIYSYRTVRRLPFDLQLCRRISFLLYSPIQHINRELHHIHQHFYQRAQWFETHVHRYVHSLSSHAHSCQSTCVKYETIRFPLSKPIFTFNFIIPVHIFTCLPIQKQTILFLFGYTCLKCISTFHSLYSHLHSCQY